MAAVLLALVAFFGTSCAGGCRSECGKLATRVCEELGDDDSCVDWKERISKLPEEACRQALRDLESILE